MSASPSVWRWCAAAVAGGVLLAGCAGDDDPVVEASPTEAPAGDDSPAPTGEVTPTSAPTATATTAPAPSPTTDVVVIRYEDGEVVGGRATVEASVGETVSIRVESDVADEVHVHGYDIHADVAPDAAAEVSFTADIPGQFEIELEERGVTLAELEVR